MRICRVLLIAGILGIGAIGFAVALRYPALLIPAAALLVYLGGKRVAQLTSHGTARWASGDDLRRAGMIGGEGMPLGRISTGRPRFWASLQALFDRRVPSREACVAFMQSMRVLQKVPPQQQVVRLNGAVHTAVFAPTRVGKGVSLVIPFLQACRDSCVVIDPKGENYRITAAQRRAMGHKVVALDPFNVVTDRPDTLNPLDMIDVNSPSALDEIRAQVKEMVIRTGTEADPFWNDAGEEMLVAITAAVRVFLKGSSLQQVRSALAKPEERVEALETMKRSELWGGMLSRLGHQAAVHSDKQLAGVLATANRHTAFLDTLKVAASTSSSSFDPMELRTGKVTVYLVLPPEHLKSQAGLLRMWIGTLLRACVRGGATEANRVQFVLDEAASLGQMEALEDAVDKYAGYGVRCLFIYQSLGQLKTCWREGKDQTLLGNCSSIYFGTRDYATAEQVSNQLGEETIVVSSGGSNTGGNLGRTTGAQHSSSSGQSWGNSANWNPTGRKLLKPEEVLNLDQRLAITFTPGVRPIMTRLLRYYEERSEAGPGPWLRTTAEVWATALGMVALAAALMWVVTNWRA